MDRAIWVLLLATLAYFIAETSAQSPTTRRIGAFRETAAGLHFDGGNWAVRSAPDRGWTSLKIDDAEFLQADESRGAMVLKNEDKWVTYFPDRGTLSHDSSAGRMGLVADGINMIRIYPDWAKPQFELYVGANQPEDQDVYLFLSDDVTFEAGEHHRVTLKHKSGKTIRIESAPVKDQPAMKLRAGKFADPAGVQRSAVVLLCKGSLANAYTVTLDAEPRTPAKVNQPRFDVRSSDDPEENIGGNAPTNGVKNPLYTEQTKLDYNVIFTPADGKPFTGWAELEVVHSLGQPHFYQRVDLKDAVAEGKNPVRVKFDPKFHLPGVSEVRASLFDDHDQLIWTDRYRMAYNWQAYKPQSDLPADFEQFWADTLKQLRANPLNATTKRVFDDHPGEFEIYHVTMTGWAGKPLHAMMFVPKNRPRPLPAIVTAHPGNRGFNINKGPDGVYGSKISADPRFVTISPLIRGYAPDDPNIPFNHPWWGPLEDRDTYVARAWYCAMVRAVDYLATREDLVDMTRVVARGGSQGGALAIVTAGLDPRVAYCLSDCPSNAQPREIMFNYPSFGPSRGQTPPGKTPQDVADMLAYYNPANFARLIKVPTWVGSNIGDVTVHSMGPLAIYHNLVQLPADQKDFYPGFSHFHGSGPGLGVKTKEILEKLGGPAPEKPKKPAATKPAKK